MLEGVGGGYVLFLWGGENRGGWSVCIHRGCVLC